MSRRGQGAHTTAGKQRAKTWTDVYDREKHKTVTEHVGFWCRNGKNKTHKNGLYIPLIQKEKLS